MEHRELNPMETAPTASGRAIYIHTEDGKKRRAEYRATAWTGYWEIEGADQSSQIAGWTWD